jgi:hypothetical protein
MPAARRCELISKIVDFKVEIHPGTFRPSIADDAETHRLAYWHGRPVVCAYARTSGHRESPIFSSDEGCKDEKFDLLHSVMGKVTDIPEACVGIEVTATGSRRVRFSARLNVIKVPPGYPTDQGRGVGFAPIEGTAAWGRNGWALRQVFDPK